MNVKNRGILTGMILGDGHLSCKICNQKKYVQLVIKHRKKQSKYALYKLNLIHSIFGGKKPKLHKICNNGYDGCVFTKSHKYLRILYNKFYKNKIKQFNINTLNYLNPQGVAIWWMDDGSLSMKKRNGKIHAREGILSTYLPLEQNQLIAKFFKDKFDVEFIPVKHKQYYRLRINTTNLKKLIPIIKPFICNSMSYKIDMQY